MEFKQNEMSMYFIESEFVVKEKKRFRYVFGETDLLLTERYTFKVPSLSLLKWLRAARATEYEH